MGIKEKFKEMLVRQQEIIYESQLAARKVNYQTWVESQEAKATDIFGETEQHEVSAKKKRAGGEPAEVVKSAEAVLLWHAKAGKLNQHALQWIEGYFAANPQIMIAYGDEDVWAKGQERKNPWYKPDWSPNTYESIFYVGSVVAVRASFIKKLCAQGILSMDIDGQESLQKDITYIRTFEKAAQVRDWLDKAIKLAGGFGKGCKNIGRIPQILFHVTEASVWEDYLQSPMSVESDNVEDTNESWAGEMGSAKLSIIIPSKDNPWLLKQCLTSLQKSLEGKNNLPTIELIVVDNGSNSENHKLLAELLQGHTYLYEPMEFNFAKMCNKGAELATGNVLLFLNDDIEFVENNWLEEMIAKAVQPYVGAVGLKLYYPNTQTIQHAGITCLPVGPVHKLQGLEDDRCYYFGKNQFVQNFWAVTGACLMLEKKKFEEAGGFEESLRVAYNDVDLCISLYESGYQNVNINTCFAYHHESLSRGSDETSAKQARLQSELHTLQQRHSSLVECDPYYPGGLNQEGLDARIVPGYHSAYNVKQPAKWLEWTDKIKDVREDACLMVQVETCEKALLQGYSVVLGDNNACYDKYLVLESTDGRRVYMPIMGQYRLDLEKNLPDQKNVALGGFCVKNPKDGLKENEYKIGVMAVHRINRLKLVNWSGKRLNLCEGTKW